MSDDLLLTMVRLSGGPGKLSHWCSASYANWSNSGNMAVCARKFESAGALAEHVISAHCPSTGQLHERISLYERIRCAAVQRDTELAFAGNLFLHGRQS